MSAGHWNPAHIGFGERGGLAAAQEPLARRRQAAHEPPDLAKYNYAIVEEILDEIVSFVVAPWPTVDEAGRLHFGAEEERREVAIDRVGLQRLLAEREVWTVSSESTAAAIEELRQRPVGVGDVFALRGALPKREGRVISHPRRYIDGPIFDLTAEARDAAKASMFAALTRTPLTPREAQRLLRQAPQADR